MMNFFFFLVRVGSSILFCLTSYNMQGTVAYGSNPTAKNLTGGDLGGRDYP